MAICWFGKGSKANSNRILKGYGDDDTVTLIASFIDSF